jgi:hypothetical protein
MTLLSGVTALLFGWSDMFHIFVFMSGLLSLVSATVRTVTFIRSCVCLGLPPELLAIDTNGPAYLTHICRDSFQPMIQTSFVYVSIEQQCLTL